MKHNGGWEWNKMHPLPERYSIEASGQTSLRVYLHFRISPVFRDILSR